MRLYRALLRMRMSAMSVLTLYHLVYVVGGYPLSHVPLSVPTVGGYVGGLLSPVL